MEESFLMVPGSASVIRQGAAQQLQASTPAYVLENVDDKFQQLARIFEIASGETRVISKAPIETFLQLKNGSAVYQ